MSLDTRIELDGTALAPPRPGDPVETVVSNATASPLDVVAATATDQMRFGGVAQRRQSRAVLTALKASAEAVDSDYLVVHGPDGFDEQRVDEMVRALEATNPNGGAADLGLADTDTDSTVSLAWRSLSRYGFATTVVHTHEEHADRTANEHPASSAPPMFVVRRSAVADLELTEATIALRRRSWWAAVLVATTFAIVEFSRVLSRSVPVNTGEQRWLATITGSADEVPLGLAGSALWPALLRSSFDTLGVGGVRLTSLVLAMVAVFCSATASSRLFGRWAARLTTVVLAVGFISTDAAIRATPTALAVAALSVALLGFALADANDRPSWLLMSGLAATIAIAADHRALVFVTLLVPFLGITRGRSGWSNSLVYIGSLAVGLVTWLTARTDDAYAIGVSYRLGTSLSDVVVPLGIVTGTAAVASLVVAGFVTSPTVRRRLAAVALMVWGLPLSAVVGGVAGTSGATAMAMLLVAPALGGVVAHWLASRHTDDEVVPVQRTTPDLLKVDPSAGQIDGNQIRYTNRQLVLAGLLVTLMAAWFFPWAIVNLDRSTLWLSIPFLAANLMVLATAMLLSFNNSRRSIPLMMSVAYGHEPLVGVIVPTAGEPVDMVSATVRSILDQDWPLERLRVIVSDDAHSNEMREHFHELAERLPTDVLTYFRPPLRGTPERIGDSKAGNLNAAVLLLHAAGCDFVETRDADDLVATPDFLRVTVSQMMLDPKLAYVQTIKESATSDGDPFNNNEILFYRGMMLARNVQHSALPCGSGLVWRRSALRDIGNFPVWNLVEDIHSGVLANRLGWRGLYVPIVGSFAQHAPEDIANYYKQRGTWAIDSIRLVMFDRFRGIPWKARLQLFEQTAFYLLSVPVMGLLLIPIIGLLFGIYPIETGGFEYALHFAGFAASLELSLFAFASNQPLRAYLRTRLFIVGMAPLYAASVMRALWFGANRKPIYVVTRKSDQHQVYVSMLKVHWALAGLMVAALVIAFMRRGEASLDTGVVYWALAGLAGLGSFLRLSWYGVNLRERTADRLRTIVTRRHSEPVS
ncbi:MAG: glycosyltransferase [Ilumatobacter sp.]